MSGVPVWCALLTQSSLHHRELPPGFFVQTLIRAGLVADSKSSAIVCLMVIVPPCWSIVYAETVAPVLSKCGPRILGLFRGPFFVSGLSKLHNIEQTELNLQPSIATTGILNPLAVMPFFGLWLVFFSADYD